MAANCSSDGNVSNPCTSCSNVTRTKNCVLGYTEFIGYFYIHTIICIIGFILNIINCIIFCRRKQFEGAAYRFMTVLSVFDALTLLISLPQGLLRCGGFIDCSSPSFQLFRQYATRFEVYVGLFMHNMTESISAWLTCFLSVERYLAIKYHYIVKAYFSPPNVHKMLAMIIGFGVIFHIPMFFVQRIVPRFSCRKNRVVRSVILTYFGRTGFYETYTWMRSLLVMFGPLLFLCVVNSLLIHLVRRQSRLHSVKQNSKGNSAATVSAAAASRSDKRARAQRKLTILLVVIICLFLCGQIPLAFSYDKIFQMLIPDNTMSFCAIRNFYRMFAQNICLLSYAANFFVYVGLNRHFRKALGELCCAVCISRQCNQQGGRKSERPNGSYRSVPMTTMAMNENNSRRVPNSGPEEEDQLEGEQKELRGKDEKKMDTTTVVVSGIPNSDSASPLDGDLVDTQDSEMCPNMGDEEEVARRHPGITAV